MDSSKLRQVFCASLETPSRLLASFVNEVAAEARDRLELQAINVTGRRVAKHAPTNFGCGLMFTEIQYLRIRVSILHKLEIVNHGRHPRQGTIEVQASGSCRDHVRDKRIQLFEKALE